MHVEMLHHWNVEKHAQPLDQFCGLFMMKECAAGMSTFTVYVVIVRLHAL